MASLYERAQNLFDDRQDRQAVADVANVKTQALTQTGDELLRKALEVQHSYRDDLVAAVGPEARKAVNAQYAARLEGINDAFTVLRQSEPAITTKLDVDAFRRDAERHAEQQARLRSYEQDRSQANDNALGLFRPSTGSGFSY
jgi:hypothetical protein